MESRTVRCAEWITSVVRKGWRVGEGTGQQINKVNKVSREKKKLRFHMIVKRLRVSLKTCSCSTSV